MSKSLKVAINQLNRNKNTVWLDVTEKLANVSFLLVAQYILNYASREYVIKKVRKNDKGNMMNKYEEILRNYKALGDNITSL